MSFSAYQETAVANADYLTAGSVAKARLFIDAVRSMLLLHTQSASQDGAAASFSPEIWERRLYEAENWLAMNDTTRGAGVRLVSFEGLR